MENNNHKIAIVVSKFNDIITNNLLSGAIEALKEHNIHENNIKIYFTPGAFEIPLMLKKLSNKKGEDKFDGIIALGCVIKGETAHFEYISNAVSLSINQISVESEIPIAFGVLTCYTPEQAFARSGVEPINEDTNKGFEAALALVEMIELLKTL